MSEFVEQRSGCDLAFGEAKGDWVMLVSVRVRQIAMLTLALVLLATWPAAPAQAQLSASTPPPPVIMTDTNGVDLKSGNFVTTSRALGAGLADDPAVSFTPLDINFNNNVGTPMVGWIQDYTCGLSDDGCVEYLVARLGNRTLNFQRSPGQMNLTAFTGERLVSDPVLGVVIYDNDDTAWIFDGAFAGSGNESFIYQTGTLQKIIYRDGRTLTYARAPNTDMTVTSNEGYQLVVRSGQNDVRLINTSIDYCSITAPSCSYSQAWPTFTRAVTGVAGNTTFTYHDPMLRTTTINSASVFGAGGHTDTNIYHPGGLHQYIRQQSVLLYQVPSGPGNLSASIWAVTNYSDDFGSATYSYTGTPAEYSSITHAVATHSDGSSLTFNLSLGHSSITDELAHTTTYSFGFDTMQPWSYSRIETLLDHVQYPELATQSWGYSGMSDPVISTITPKPGSGQAAIASNGSFNTNCVNGRTCHLLDYFIDARGARTDYTYDPNSGMRLTETLPPDSNGVRRETRYTWQQLHATYRQSPGGPLVAGTPIWKLVATSTCRTMAGAACVGTADEVRTAITYNGNLLPISETTQAGDGSLVSTVTRDYDANGNVIWVDGPMPGTVDRTYFFWNLDREPIGEVGPDPDGAGPLSSPAVRRTFDVEGRLTQVETGTASAQTLVALNAMSVLVTQITTYDTLGRKLTERRSSGADQTLVQYSYGYKGLLECTAVRMNPAIYGSLPASACTLGAQGSFGPDRITRNVYDAAGRLSQVQRAYGITTANGFPATLQQNYATYTRSADGMVTSMTDADGNRAEMTWDGFDRQRRWIFPSTSTHGVANPSDYEEYSYDANGNRTSLRRRDGTTLAYTYDNLNRMTVKVVPSRVGLTAAQTRDVYYGYDLLGHQMFARFDSAAGEGVSNSWDALGRLTSTTQAMDGQSRTLSYQYDLAGNRTRVTHPDGQYFAYAYDALGRLTTLGENSATTVLTASYNPAGLPATLTRSGAATTFGYDAVNRLNALTHDLAGTLSDVAWTNSFNPASQIVTRTRSNDAYAWDGAVAVSRNYAVNGLNQYTAAGTATFAYDANGNLTSDGSSTYLYDVENRLVQVSGGHSATLVYDPLGRLHQVGSTRLLYDGDALVAEYNTSGTLLRRYVHGSNAAADDPLLWYEGATVSSTTRHQLFADHQGSIVAITDGAGTLTDHGSYDEWGIPGSTNNLAERFQYTGQAWLPEVGLYYYKARIYSPTLGRFMQTDPVGYEGGNNLYAYVGDDPVNEADPTGTQIAGTFSIETSCHGDAGCIQGYREGQARIGQVTWEVLSWVGPLFIPVAGEEIDAARITARLAQAGERASAEEEAVTTVRVSRSAHPEAASHIERAQAAGQPRRLTVDRVGSAARRREALRGTPTRSGADRDEYPPAMFEEGGNGSSVEHINPSDNRGAGASISNQCRSVRNGGKVSITVCN